MTSINARSCPYAISLSHKQVGLRGSGVFGLVLGIRDDTHSHELATNPLRYKQHIKLLPEFQPTLQLAQSLRSANISYSKAIRVLKQANFPLDRKTYYNSI